MKKINKKLIIASIFIVAFILLLSTITYARPFTEILSGGLLQINNFFENEGYAPYATAIDFFFFSLLFIAIYMMGARYSFKEVKRPEQVIVILLGLMTAFLLVLADISAVILLPYIHWLFYVLLFMLYWWLLKGVQNKFWRFVLALLLTILTIALVQGLYNYLTRPEIPEISAPGVPSFGLGGIGDFFRSLGDSFKGISMPGVSAPGVPGWARDLWGLPSVSQPTGPAGLPTVPTTPTTPAPPTQPTPWYKTWNWLWLLLLLPLIWFLARRRQPQITPTTQETPVTNIQEPINKINEALAKKKKSKKNIERLKNEKNNLVQQGDVKTGFIAKLRSSADEDIANLFLDKSRTLEDLEEGNIQEFIKKEREFLLELENLGLTELEILNSFTTWETIILQKVSDDKKVNAKNYLYLLKVLISQHVEQRAEDKQKGILQLIAFCFNLEKKQNILAVELTRLFEPSHLKELVKGRFKEAIKDEVTLEAYNQKEDEIIALLLRRIAEQIRILGLLQDLITPTAVEPTEIEELKVKYNNAAGNTIELTKDQAADPANTIPLGTEITVFTRLIRGAIGKFKVIAYIDKVPVKMPDGQVLVKEIEKTAAQQNPEIKFESGEFLRSLLPGEHEIALYIVSSVRPPQGSTRGVDLKKITIHIGPRAGHTQIKVEYKGYEDNKIKAIIHDLQNKYQNYLLSIFVRKQGTTRWKPLKADQADPNVELEIPLEPQDFQLEYGLYEIILRAKPIVNNKILQKERYDILSIIKFKLPIKVEVMKPEKYPKPTFSVGGIIYQQLEAQAVGKPEIVEPINNEQNYKFVWYIEQIGKGSAAIHTGRSTDISYGAIPDYFEQGDASLRIIVYDESLDRIAEDVIDVFLLKGVALVRREADYIPTEPEKPITAIEPEEKRVIAPEVTPTIPPHILTQMQDMARDYNKYSDETKKQWEDTLKAKYRDKIRRVSVKGIEDMGIFDSYKNLPLEEHPSGNFLLILMETVEGYIFPVPWLRFNNTTLTVQLKPFYNIPEPGSEGVIEAVEQPAYLKKLADGKWEIISKGIIRFRGGKGGKSSPTPPKAPASSHKQQEGEMANLAGIILNSPMLPEDKKRALHRLIG